MSGKIFVSILICVICVFRCLESPAKATVNYTYTLLTNDLFDLKRAYMNELELISIGQTHFGKEIWAVKLGKGQENILLVGAHHGREWMTSALLVNMIRDYTASYIDKKSYGHYNTDILDDVSIWFVPMLNPDGVNIQQGQFQDIPIALQLNILQMNGGSNQFKRWKANGVGIDLNRQYPSGWKESKGKADVPYYQFYKGKKPLEAMEAKNLVRFTNKVKPLLTVAYHSSGRELYWNYKNGKNTNRDYELTERVSKLTGYKISETPDKAFGAGYTDWFITTFHRPAMTIEISPYVGETNPPMVLFKEEWRRNKYVGIMLAHEAKSHIHTHKK